MPLILQHNGHSRIIVGYEVDGRGITNLLMFDPSQYGDQLVYLNVQKINLF